MLLTNLQETCVQPVRYQVLSTNHWTLNYVLQVHVLLGARVNRQESWLCPTGTLSGALDSPNGHWAVFYGYIIRCSQLTRWTLGCVLQVHYQVSCRVGPSLRMSL